MSNKFQEIKDAVANHKALSKFGHVGIVTNNIDFMKALLQSYGQWNDYNGTVVADTIEIIFEMLPRVYYNEGNPNNGNRNFKSVNIHSDSLITLSMYGTLSEDEIAIVKRIIDTYGQLMKADERTLTIDDKCGQYKEYTIRFWWD